MRVSVALSILIAIISGVASAEAGTTNVRKTADISYQPMAAQPEYRLEQYSYAKFADQATSIPWMLAGIYGGLTVVGFQSWDWGSSGFRFNSEGWFGKDTGSMGMDKLGHAYTSYLITEVLTYGINRNAGDPYGAEITAGILTAGVMTYVEVFDGFSGDHGFSWEDMAFNAGGIGFSILRNSIPGLRDKLDFRLQYVPSGNKDGFHPITDYSGQKYVLALKLAGFEAFEDTPARFLELHAGYYARGFTDEEEDNGDERRREPYVGIGLNLQELIFGYPSVRDTGVGRWGRTALEYIQVPYTYIPTKGFDDH